MKARIAITGFAALFLLRADAYATTASSSPECGGTIDPTTLDPTSTKTTFAAGSLIIPMDSCYNPDNPGNSGPMNVGGSCGAGPSYTCYNNYGGGNARLPFGVLYLLAENNIPVSIILNQSKTALNQFDFSISPTTGGSVATAVHVAPSSTGYTTDALLGCGTHTVYYGGMPFVVEATFAAQALQVITAFDNANGNLFTPVTFHVSNYPFTAPTLAVMASRPKPVLIDSAPLDTFFGESGITSVAAANTTFLWLSASGSSYSYTWPASFTSPAGCSSTGVCTSLVDSSSNRIVDVVWSSNLIGNLNNWSSMGSYFQHGGTVLGLDDAQSFESGSGGSLGGGISINSKGAEKGAFCPAVATSASNPLTTAGPTSQYPASNRFLQLDDIDISIQGNGGGVDGSSGWNFGSAPAARTQVLSNGDGNEAIAGHPMVNGTQTQGNLVYLASLNSWHGNSGNKDGGLHILYNTLIAGGGGSNTSCAAAELTRSSSVANLVTLSSGATAYAEYLGSFDWAVPSSGAALGNVLYQANPADYPYMTGHFREYKPTGTYTVSTSTSNTAICSPTDSASPCNWDAATKMKPFASRNVFVATGSFPTYSLTRASTLTASDSTMSYISTHLDNKDASGTSTSGILGGIDWSTAAVIEARNVGGFTGRPTIAYVGARDGMLHAFCVKPGTGATTCYGAAAGEEIWAVIPPGMKSRMTTAYNGGTNMDWSSVNVGGAIRVADMSDKFAGASAAVTRTILIVGMHDSGYVDALDISNPDPSNVNNDGFRFLWENDGTHVASTATSMPMGPTNGATLAQVTATASTGVAVVTSATCYNTGLSSTACPSTVTPGYNTYAIRLADGVIVSDEQNLYTLKSSLLNAPIANDPPPLATSVDLDGDGTDETVYVSTLEGRIRKYTMTAQGVSTPTLAVFDSAHAASNVYNANSIGGCANGVACQPIGVSPTLVRSATGGIDVLVATGGADWARATTDRSDLLATTNQSYLTGFDATTQAQFPSSPLKLGGIQPPVSAAGGSSAGTSNPVPLSLRAYAQLTVAGSDLYANVTSVSIGSMQQLLLPLMTPGTYGNVLRWSNINTTTPVAYGSILATGTSYAGGAGSVLETNTSTTDAEIFVAGATSSIRQTLSGSSTSLRSPAYAINKSAGSRPFTTLSWFDLSN